MVSRAWYQRAWKSLDRLLACDLNRRGSTLRRFALRDRQSRRLAVSRDSTTPAAAVDIQRGRVPTPPSSRRLSSTLRGAPSPTRRGAGRASPPASRARPRGRAREAGGDARPAPRRVGEGAPRKVEERRRDDGGVGTRPR